jgi:ankyrin repeat protein
MNLPPPPPQADDPIITQFKPDYGQWELTEDNINRIDPETGHTILHNYCQHINTTPLGVWRYLIETRGCDINAQDNKKDTPLHRAFRYFNPKSDIAVLTYLFSQKGINGDAKDQYGYTILHKACERINELPKEIFELLIETVGCDVNAQDYNLNTPLHRAFCCFDRTDGGKIAVLIHLLTQKGINCNIKGQSGYTLLHYASNEINGPINIFKLLIETHGADVNIQNDNNDTPVHLAFRSFKHDNGGNIDVLAYLINQQTVNVNIKGKKGHNLLHLACLNNLLDSRRFVKLNPECDTNLCRIVEVIAERCVQEVLDAATM